MTGGWVKLQQWWPTDLLNGLHDSVLHWLLHGHDSLNVLLLRVTVHRTAQDQLQQAPQFIGVVALSWTQTQRVHNSLLEGVGYTYLSINASIVKSLHIHTASLHTNIPLMPVLFPVHQSLLCKKLPCACMFTHACVITSCSQSLPPPPRVSRNFSNMCLKPSFLQVTSHDWSHSYQLHWINSIKTHWYLLHWYLLHWYLLHCYLLHCYLLHCYLLHCYLLHCYLLHWYRL